jgi:hypothetical protein
MILSQFHPLTNFTTYFPQMLHNVIFSFFFSVFHAVSLPEICICFLYHPSEVHISVASVSVNEIRPSVNMENQPPASEMKNVSRQYSDLKDTGDSSQVSEHYQYCFRNTPYDDSNQQYRKTGNGLLYLLTSVTGGIQKYCALVSNFGWDTSYID